MRDSSQWENHAMPRACIVGGCRNRAVAGRSRCSLHGPKNLIGPNPYGYDHQQEREARLKANPVCAIDGRPGTPADPLQLDHIVPIRLGGTGHPSNLRLIHRSENLHRRLEDKRRGK